MNWAAEEFEGIDIGDERLNKRATKILSTLGEQPEFSIPTACKGWDETIASYRFFQNEKVTIEKVLAPHVTASLSRIREHKIVLLVQDTTELDYTSKQEKMEGLGVLNHERRQGLLCHPLVAFSPERVCLGVLDLLVWGREQKNFGKSKDRYNKALEEKESYRWIEGYRKASSFAEQLPDTEVIMVADSESDMYDLFEEASVLGEKGAQWLVRGKFNRALAKKRQDNTYVHLYDRICSQKSLGSIEFKLPGRSSKKRKVRQTLRACRVTLRPPHRSQEKLTPQQVTVVLAKETHPLKGKEPIEWLLLTSKEVKTFDDAAQIVNYYLARWQIEVFFKVLKSGCKVEELQLEHTEHLYPCLALYSIIAWRVLFLTVLSRECPDLPCNAVFEELEWKAAYTVTYREKPPDCPPTLNSMIKIIAQFGGYLARKNDPPPGTKALWIGIQRNKDFALGQQALNHNKF